MRQEMTGFWEAVASDGRTGPLCKQSAHRSRQITTPTCHHSIFYRSDALSDAQPTVSKHWRQILHIMYNSYFVVESQYTLGCIQNSTWIWSILVSATMQLIIWKTVQMIILHTIVYAFYRGIYQSIIHTNIFSVISVNNTLWLKSVAYLLWATHCSIPHLRW